MALYNPYCLRSHIERAQSHNSLQKAGPISRAVRFAQCHINKVRLQKITCHHLDDATQISITFASLHRRRYSYVTTYTTSQSS